MAVGRALALEFVESCAHLVGVESRRRVGPDRRAASRIDPKGGAVGTEKSSSAAGRQQRDCRSLMHRDERLAVVAFDAEARVTSLLEIVQELIGKRTLLPSDVTWGHGLDAIFFFVDPKDRCLKC